MKNLNRDVCLMKLVSGGEPFLIKGNNRKVFVIYIPTIALDPTHNVTVSDSRLPIVDSEEVMPLPCGWIVLSKVDGSDVGSDRYFIADGTITVRYREEF